MRHTRVMPWSLAIGIGLAAACGGGDEPAAPTSPTAPTPTRPVIVTSVASTPLTAVGSIGPGGKTVFTVATPVTFRETAGAPGRVVALIVSLLDDSGPLAPTFQQGLDLPLPALGTVQYRTPLHRGTRALRGTGTCAVRGTGKRCIGHRRRRGTRRRADPLPRPSATGGRPVTFAGAGDIGLCGSAGPEATARFLDAIPGLVFTLGDNVYPYASAGNFQNCYDPSWGRHRARTRPIAGNHDWYNNYWGAYFDYFGASAGPPGLGYYSYDLGTWHVLALNSNLHGNAGSPQYEWVRADLASTRSACILTLWHHPRYSSGPSGGDTTMKDIWRLLQDAGAELVLSGHDHIYERFAPQDADGRLDRARGIRQFVVGTGGYTLYDLGPAPPNSEVRDNHSWGILKLSLNAVELRMGVRARRRSVVPRLRHRYLLTLNELRATTMDTLPARGGSSSSLLTAGRLECKYLVDPVLVPSLAPFRADARPHRPAGHHLAGSPVSHLQPLPRHRRPAVLLAVQTRRTVAFQVAGAHLLRRPRGAGLPRGQVAGQPRRRQAARRVDP